MGASLITLGPDDDLKMCDDASLQTLIGLALGRIQQRAHQMQEQCNVESVSRNIDAWAKTLHECDEILDILKLRAKIVGILKVGPGPEILP